MKRYVGRNGRKALFCALIGMSLALISCAKSPYDQNLPTPSGQVSVVSNQYPAVVMVILPGGEGMCTGTFVSANTVLTAAHCALNNGTYQVISSFGTFSTSTRYVLGPGQVNDPNDIALLVFDHNVASSDQIYEIGDDVREGDEIRLVGFGCNNISTKQGAGEKRTGTNVVASVDDYVNFLTPATADNGGSRAILGPGNRAGSCFGDSGGPALKARGNTFVVVAVTHAGGSDGSNLLSEYVNVASRSDNRNWLAQQSRNQQLGIQGL